MNLPVPFNFPSLGESAIDSVVETLRTPFLAGNGTKSRQAEAILGEYFQHSRVLLTNSCSSALDLSAALLNLGSGDEVIVPSFTFPTSVSGVVRAGATPVFADISRDTLGLDFEQVMGSVSNRTRAVFLTHYAGIPADVLRFSQALAEIGVALVEDNAHGLGVGLGGKPLGSFGSLSTLSFHETKNLTSGEGGALVVNDEDLIEKARVLREKGTNRERFLRGEIDKYSWVAPGSNYLLSEVLAAILVDQLLRIDEIFSRRRQIWKRYLAALSPVVEESGFSLPKPEAGDAAHIFFLIAPSQPARNALIDYLADRGIQAVTHYEPLHRSHFGKRFVRQDSKLAVTDEVASGILRLPLHLGLSDSQVDYVSDCVVEFLRGGAPRVRD